MTYISSSRRKKAATVHSGGKDKFPVDSVQTAKSAAKLLNSAKPKLSSGQRANVMSNVHQYLPNAKPPSQKPLSKKNKG